MTLEKGLKKILIVVGDPDWFSFNLVITIERDILLLSQNK